MHAEAMEFLRRLTIEGPVIEIGSRNVNGSARDAFPGVEWFGIDMEDGPEVDLIADATTWSPNARFRAVVCCEVLEHEVAWRHLLKHVATWSHQAIPLIITCAGPGRQPHSAIDGGPLREGEYYANISAEELRAELLKAGFRTVYADQYGADTRAIAMK